ncbi:hypothetical protein ABEF95_015001 [Exophiala dermatitidis]|uniref:Uncharacterized protein n=1 Tax=Exophiala dermatitidis (strain ATCC 34100 / CBS 525.76 / NIH/UT8656) TaxID=858893 RepID=H6BRU5_EXODN|nr:uncharacterized protein HMPREF1120_02224 [Exophiala dermatitidis NIH/UT8656]EHY54047.1 hypothetical protein HMPREF1120_02224 [Exophiala dermatitidis NIH/UT8656]
MTESGSGWRIFRSADWTSRLNLRLELPKSLQQPHCLDALGATDMHDRIEVLPIKPFWPVLFTFVLPRAINYYRVIKTAIRTRPPPRPLPAETGRGLNALFVSICVFLYLSLPSFLVRSDLTDHNVFQITQSRLSTATDTLFARLALLREDGILTATDEALRAKLGSQALRQIYLRFGPSTLLNCTFCTADDAFSFLLYHLPINIILPHLFHILCIGLATSEPVAGFEASRWRSRALLGATILASIDIGLTSTYTGPSLHTNPRTHTQTPPLGIFWIASTLRYLVLSLFDAALAFFIYASAIYRFLLFSNNDSTDPEVARRRTEELLAKTNLALQMSQTNLRAYSVARNTVVRKPDLKAAEDEYWRRVVDVESLDDESLLDDEEVQAAVSRAYGSGAVDVAAMRREAEMFVKHATKILD